MINLLKPNFNYYEKHKEHYKRIKARDTGNSSITISPEQEKELEKAYSQYENLFQKNELNKLSKYNFFNKEEKNKYLLLYKYKYKIFQELKQNSKYIDNNNVVDCPFCEHGTPGTFDHFVPKGVDNYFPEFCDNLLNLMPVCSNCNTLKGDDFLDGEGKLLFINLYTDILPDEQYLIVSFTIDTSLKSINYSIDKSVIKDSLLANKLEYTFNKLEIISSYNDLAMKRISDIKKTIQSFKNDKLDPDHIKLYIKHSYPNKNFWLDVLYRAIAQDPDTFNYFYNE